MPSSIAQTISPPYLGLFCSITPRISPSVTVCVCVPAYGYMIRMLVHRLNMGKEIHILTRAAIDVVHSVPYGVARRRGRDLLLLVLRRRAVTYVCVWVHMRVGIGRPSIDSRPRSRRSVVGRSASAPFVVPSPSEPQFARHPKQPTTYQSCSKAVTRRRRRAQRLSGPGARMTGLLSLGKRRG